MRACRMLIGLLSVAVSLHAADRGEPWPRHVIDNSSRGADGTRLADVNADGLPDITCPWEQGGVIRVYLNPGPAEAGKTWPAVTVGKVGSPEDSVFVDLDGDGATDVVSCCEGRVRTAWVHWAPKDKAKYLDPAAWTTEAIPATRGKQMWMFALPMQIDGRHGVDIVLASKGGNATIGWLQAPARPRDLAAWTWHPLYKARWIMSLIAADLDGDGDTDVLASDRKGKSRGCLWLENPGPGPKQTKPWPEHRIGEGKREIMFLDYADLDRDGLTDVLGAVKGGDIVWHRRTSKAPVAWETLFIPMPPNTGTGKAVAVGDIDGDGRPDVVFSCEHARGKRSGAGWLAYRKAPTDRDWEAHEIGGPQGVKYDMVKLLDLDADGDLDVLTCEESHNLGVVWYENPTR
ncbi:MAG: FG-GAP repeat domain-containing protein [Planctomycetota bacterium]